MMGDNGLAIFLCMWIASYPSTICWKGYIFHNLIVLASLLKSIAQKRKALFLDFQFYATERYMSILMPMSRFLAFCSLVVTLKSGSIRLPTFIFLFQDYFGYSWSFVYLLNFRDSLSISLKKESVILIRIILNL